MDKYRKLAELLKGPGGSLDTFIYAIVSKVSGDTCSIKIGDLELKDVRLRATCDNASDKLLITPKLNSQVIVAANNGDLRDLFLVKVDDPEKIAYKHNGLCIEIDGTSGLVKIENKQESLKKLLSDLIAEIEKLTVTTGTGPSGTPINLPKFKVIEQRVTKLLS